MQVAVDGELACYQQMVESITDYEVIRLDDSGQVRTWNEGAAPPPSGSPTRRPHSWRT